MALRLRPALWITVAALLSVSLLLGQSRKPEDLAAGKLLVVPRDSPDPNFAESVVLLIHYGEDGVLGLMMNRRTTLPVSRVLRELKGASKDSDPVYVGGPVEMQTVLALLQSRAELHDATHVFGNIYLVSTKRDLETALAAGMGPSELRIYVGYCGWARGQLENEVRRGGWYIFNGSEGLVFDSNPSTIWSRMIARTELRTARLQGSARIWPSR